MTHDAPEPHRGDDEAPSFLPEGEASVPGGGDSDGDGPRHISEILAELIFGADP